MERPILVDVHAIMDRFRLENRCKKVTLFWVEFRDVEKFLDLGHPFSDKSRMTVIAGMGPARFALCQPAVIDAIVEFSYMDRSNLASALAALAPK